MLELRGDCLPQLHVVLTVCVVLTYTAIRISTMMVLMVVGVFERDFAGRISAAIVCKDFAAGLTPLALVFEPGGSMLCPPFTVIAAVDAFIIEDRLRVSHERYEGAHRSMSEHRR